MNDDFFLKLSHRVAPLRISSCITLSLFSYSFRVTNAHFIRVFFFSLPGKEIAPGITFMGLFAALCTATHDQNRSNWEEW